MVDILGSSSILDELECAGQIKMRRNWCVVDRECPCEVPDGFACGEDVHGCLTGRNAMRIGGGPIVSPHRVVKQLGGWRGSFEHALRPPKVSQLAPFSDPPHMQEIGLSDMMGLDGQDDQCDDRREALS